MPPGRGNQRLARRRRRPTSPANQYASLLNADEDPRIFLPFEVYGRQFRALVDSGAARSFLHRDTVEWCRQHGCTSTPTETLVRVADGAQVAVDEQIRITARVDGLPFTHEYAVLPTLTQDAFLGMDALWALGATITIGAHRWGPAMDTAAVEPAGTHTEDPTAAPVDRALMAPPRRGPSRRYPDLDHQPSG